MGICDHHTSPSRSSPIILPVPWCLFNVLLCFVVYDVSQFRAFILMWSCSMAMQFVLYQFRIMVYWHVAGVISLYYSIILYYYFTPGHHIRPYYITLFITWYLYTILSLHCFIWSYRYLTTDVYRYGLNVVIWSFVYSLYICNYSIFVLNMHISLIFYL